MKNILITGSNGMIGRLILESCLERNDVAKITSITRKPIGITHPKLLEVLHDNFLDYSGIEQHFINQDTCFFCIGVYTGAVSRDEFRKITVEYTVAFAETLKRNSPEVVFCFLSGQGADSSEKSKVMFALDKGIAENALIKLNFKQLSIFRPGYIYPVTPRSEPNTMYRVMRILYKPLISKIYPNIGLSSEQLANAMVHIGFNGGDKIIYENKQIKAVAD
ncbi:MAG: epimerase [Bacteroidota bacterium]